MLRNAVLFAEVCCCEWVMLWLLRDAVVFDELSCYGYGMRELL